MVRHARSLGAALLITSCGACERGAGSVAVVARYEGGVVTASDLHREASRLPPVLRARFETESGRRELIGAIIDRRLLIQEARARKLHEDEEVRRQVDEFEERLVVKAFLAIEEAKARASEADLRSWYDAHRADLAQPERVQVRRVLARAAPGSPASERDRARGRAEAFLARLRRGEPFERVAASGEGDERARGGDLGLVARGTSGDAALEAAAFALTAPGARSGVVACADGFAVLELAERRPARVPAFEEARGDVENRLAAQLQRKAFDEVTERLRAKARVRIE